MLYSDKCYIIWYKNWKYTIYVNICDIWWYTWLCVILRTFTYMCCKYGWFCDIDNIVPERGCVILVLGQKPRTKKSILGWSDYIVGYGPRNLYIYISHTMQMEGVFFRYLFEKPLLDRVLLHIPWVSTIYLNNISI